MLIQRRHQGFRDQIVDLIPSHVEGERLEVWQDGEVVGRHPRAFGSNKTVYNPLHYVDTRINLSVLVEP